MLKVKLTDNATATLRRLQAQGQDLTPALNDIGNALIQSTQTRFWDTKTDPSGKKWHELSPIYALIKKKRGQKNGILIGEGSLVGGLVKEVTPNAVIIGATDEYARRQQFGGGGIPSRPFLGVSNQDLEFIERILQKHLK